MESQLYSISVTLEDPLFKAKHVIFSLTNSTRYWKTNCS